MNLVSQFGLLIIQQVSSDKCYFEFIDRLPLTAAGKSDKKALRQEVKKRLEKEKR